MGRCNCLASVTDIPCICNDPPKPMTNPSSDVLELADALFERLGQRHDCISEAAMALELKIAFAATIERLSAELERAVATLRRTHDDILLGAEREDTLTNINAGIRSILASLTLPPTNNERSQSV